VKKVSDNILTRVYILFALFLLAGFLVLVRVMALQINRPYWVNKELEEKVFFKRVVADRGNILSEDGTILATSVPFYKIAIDATILDTTRLMNYSLQDSAFALAVLLAEKFDEENKDTTLYFNRIMDAFREKDRHTYLTRKMLSFRELEEVKQWPIINLGRYKGGFITEKIHNKRHYPFDDLARVTLGLMRNDTLGIRGIEASYNNELRGRDGYILAQKIRGGAHIPLDEYGEEESQDGMDVTTTLDMDIQDMVYTALKRGVEKNEARFGTAILVEVETGKIKALANYPESYNHGVARLHEPGSTFKVASAMAVLEDKLMDICDTVDTGDGKIEIADDKEITDGAAYGKLTFEQGFAKSSNVFWAKLVDSLYKDNPEWFIQYLERLGLTETAISQLVGEPDPVVHRPGDDMWTMANLPSMAIGYSVQVTPLQMATAYNTIANNGIRVKPWLIKEVREDAEVIRTFGPEVIQERVCSHETAMRLREMMMEVVEYGTARNIKGTSFRIAGKTGTARKTQNGKYVKKYVSSFGGFFPAGRPRYTLYIMVDEPSTGRYYGAQVAAPIFKEIAERVYEFDWEMANPPTKRNSRPTARPSRQVLYADNANEVFEGLKIETSELPDAEWVVTKDNEHQVDFKQHKVSDGRIPNVRGMSSRDALLMLEKAGVNVRLVGHGRVKRQSLLPGYRVGKNTNITLYLG
jgi:cell division protein FtsI (penicillin-binding protein 3)